MGPRTNEYSDYKKSLIKKETHFCKHCGLGFRHAEAHRDHEDKCPKARL